MKEELITNNTGEKRKTEQKSVLVFAIQCPPVSCLAAQVVSLSSRLKTNLTQPLITS